MKLANPTVTLSMAPDVYKNRMNHSLHGAMGSAENLTSLGARKSNGNMVEFHHRKHSIQARTKGFKSAQTGSISPKRGQFEAYDVNKVESSNLSLVPSKKSLHETHIDEIEEASKSVLKIRGKDEIENDLKATLKTSQLKSVSPLQ